VFGTQWDPIKAGIRFIREVKNLNIPASIVVQKDQPFHTLQMVYASGIQTEQSKAIIHLLYSQSMDITFISDTHGLHRRLKLKPGTVLIHTGDVTEYGSEDEVVEFLSWFSRQPFDYKVFIAGNHDLFLEDCTPAKRRKTIPSDIIYLQNSGIEIAGLKVWGSPVTPYFLGMAFNARQGLEIKRVWNKIPSDTDILITHGPPAGILDNGIGDEGLLLKVNKIQPLVHCFGHAHGQNGVETNNETTFINASIVNSLDPFKNEDYSMIGQPVIYKI